MLSLPRHRANCRFSPRAIRIALLLIGARHMRSGHRGTGLSFALWRNGVVARRSLSGTRRRVAWDCGCRACYARMVWRRRGCGLVCGWICQKLVAAGWLARCMLCTHQSLWVERQPMFARGRAWYRCTAGRRAEGWSRGLSWEALRLVAVCFPSLFPLSATCRDGAVAWSHVVWSMSGLRQRGADSVGPAGLRRGPFR